MKKWKSPDQKCGEFMKVMALRLEWIKEAWIPYCRNEITYKKLESLRKKLNKDIELLISSFNRKEENNGITTV